MLKERAIEIIDILKNELNDSPTIWKYFKLYLNCDIYLYGQMLLENDIKFLIAKKELIEEESVELINLFNELIEILESFHTFNKLSH